MLHQLPEFAGERSKKTHRHSGAAQTFNRAHRPVNSPRVRASSTAPAAAPAPVGPPVVLMHGTPFSSYVWRELAAALSLRRTVYLWDMLALVDAVSLRPWAASCSASSATPPTSSRPCPRPPTAACTPPTPKPSRRRG